MVSIIIQGPKQPGNDIDIYFQLLMNELKQLWAKKGVRCYDAFERQFFNLRAVLLHTIQDMPALGNTLGRKQREKWDV